MLCKNSLSFIFLLMLTLVVISCTNDGIDGETEKEETKTSETTVDDKKSEETEKPDAKACQRKRGYPKYSSMTYFLEFR